MALKGDLASVDLAQVFQMLALNQKAGLLTVFTAQTWKALCFDQRGVTLYFNPYGFPDKVLEHLVRAGRLAESAVENAKEDLKARGGSLEESLARTAGLPSEEFRRTFSLLMEEEIYDLFFWQEARFEFLEGAAELPGREGMVDEGCFFNPDSMIMEAARRMDEWSVIRERISSPLDVFQPAVDPTRPGTAELPDNILSVFELLDGKRNVGRLLEITGFTSFQVYKALATLVDQGLVAAVGPADLAANAIECLAEGRTADGINLLEKAVAAGVGGPDTQLTLARAYESSGEFARSARHLQAFAENLVARGETEEACQVLREAVTLLPTDLRARERLVDLAVAMGGGTLKNGYDPSADGRELIEIFLDLGEFERARTLLERLLAACPGDLDLIKSLISIHSKAGDTKRVVELHEVLANELLRRKDLMGAIKYLQKILLIDRDRKDVSDRIRQLYLKEERVRSRRRGLVTLTVVAAILALLGGLYSWYEMTARRDFAGIDPASHLAEKDFVRAAGLYQDFLDRYPLSLLRSRANEELNRIRSRETAWREEEAAQRLRLEKEQERRREAYLRLHRRYEAHVSGERKDLVKALEALEEAGALVRANNTRDDLAWARSVGLDENLRDLRTYLEGAEELRVAVDRSLSSGDYKRAYLQARELQTRYGLSPLAAAVGLPIQVVSEPPGAALLAGGEPLRDGRGRPLTAPCVVPVRPGQRLELELRHEGHRPTTLVLDGASESPAKVALPLQPVAKLSLPATPLGGAAGDGGLVVASVSGGRILGLEAGASSPRWTARLPGLAEVTGGPILAEGRVLLATSGSAARAYDLASGQGLWEILLPGVVHSRPLALPGRVFMGTTAGSALLLDAATGHVLWHVRLGGGIHASAAWTGTEIFVPLDTNQVAALDLATGALTRTFQTGGPVRSAPLVMPSRLIVAALDGRVHSFPLRGPEPPWIFQHGGNLRLCRLVPSGQGVLVAREDGRLFRLAEGGEAVQDFDFKHPLQAGPIQVGNRIYLAVAVAKGQSSLICLDPETLAPRWEYPLTGVVVPPIAFQQGLALVTTGDGLVLAFP